MLIHFYIFWQLIALISFVVFYYRKDIFWGGTSLILSGLIAVASYGIRIPVYVYNATVTQYVIQQKVYSYPYLAGINIGLFSITMMYLIYIIVTEYKNPIVGPEVK